MRRRWEDDFELARSGRYPEPRSAMRPTYLDVACLVQRLRTQFAVDFYEPPDRILTRSSSYSRMTLTTRWSGP